ncbi:MAG: hypothetical protein J6V40_03955, partial [Clostridia bacterium]|nr:hypothetical protein [Clostridia bacterium]
MITIDMINNLDDINNFRQLQKVLLAIGVDPDMVNNCAVMETIVYELQKAAFGQKTSAISIDTKHIKIGETDLTIDNNGDITIKDHIAKVYTYFDRSQVRPLTITHLNDRRSEKYVIKGRMPTMCGETTNYARDVDENGVVTYQCSIGEWLRTGCTRVEYDNEPYLVYRFASSDIEDVENPPAPRLEIDNGDPTSVMSLAVPFDPERAKQLIERYPNIHTWYETRFGKNYDLDAITATYDEVDRPHTLKEKQDNYRERLLESISKYQQQIRAMIPKLSKIDCCAALGRVKGVIAESNITQALSVM